MIDIITHCLTMSNTAKNIQNIYTHIDKLHLQATIYVANCQNYSIFLVWIGQVSCKSLFINVSTQGVVKPLSRPWGCNSATPLWPV